MSPNKTIKEITALREAAIEDLMSMSDAELRAEAREAGDDLEAIASQARQSMREAAAGALRKRMNAAKTRSSLGLPQRPLPATRPSLNRIKQMIQQLFERDPAVGLAFREGKRQSESDWQSLYDDLIAVGALKAENNEH